MDDPRRFCDAFETWANATMSSLDSDDQEKREWREEFGEHWAHIQLAIVKSCLLQRLIYGRERLRTHPCPVHNGRWSGITDPPCQHCGIGPSCRCNTGWLPEA
jgi:hypothetical protein